MALRLIFFALNLALCRHLLMISERLLRVLAQDSSKLKFGVFLPRRVDIRSFHYCMLGRGEQFPS